MKANGVLQIVIGATLFGLIPFFVRYAPGLTVTQIALGRSIFAGLFALVLVYSFKERLNVSDLKGKNFFHLFVWSVFLTLAIITYFLAINYGSVAIAGTLMGLHPIFVVLFSYLFFKEKIQSITYISCIVALLGAAFIGFGTDSNTEGLLIGGVFALISAFFLGLNFTYHLKFLNHLSSSRLVFYQNVLQIPLLLPFVFFDPIELEMKGLVSVLSLGILCTGIAYFLIYNGSKYVKKQFIGVLQMIENVIPIILGVLIYQEQLQSMQWIGIALITFSALIIGFSSDKH